MPQTIDDLLFQLNSPHFYTGAEINVVKKGFRKDFYNICLTFADTYEIGMSSGGFRLNYHLLNSFPDVNAERLFMPHEENFEHFRREGLFTLESRRRPADFDLIAFSLMSELNYTNFLWLLKLAAIPVFSRARNDKYPLVLGGGMAMLNPEPLAPFLDFVAIGEAESLWREILPLLKDHKRQKISRCELFGELAGHPAIYCPNEVSRQRQGRFVIPVETGQKKKQYFEHFSQKKLNYAEIVPLGNTVFNRLNIELVRGCAQSCRFCQARSYYNPLRTVKAEKVLQEIDHALSKTGHSDISLAALSSGDYPYLGELLAAIRNRFSSGTSFSFPSLRPGTLSPEMLETLADFRRTGITLAVEAGSVRLRNLLNKNLSDDEIFAAVELMGKYGWKKLKVYFIIGIPRETSADIEQTIELIEKIRRLLKRNQPAFEIHLSFSPFVPKPHTSLQWAGFMSPAEIEEHIGMIKKTFGRDRRIKFDFHSIQRARVETVLARGDIRVANLLLSVFQKNERFTAWENSFRRDCWEQALSAFKHDEFLNEIPLEQPLPWGFIELNFRPEYLRREYQRAMNFEPTIACEENDCARCHGCYLPLKKVKKEKINFPGPTILHEKKKIEFPVWLFFRKEGDLRFFPHLTMIQYVERVLRRCALPLIYTTGFHPRLKMTFIDPLPVGAQSRSEPVELFLYRRLELQELLAALKNESIDFFRVHYPCRSGLQKQISRFGYFIYRPQQEFNFEELLDDFQTEEIVSIRPEGVELSVDLKNGGQKRFSSFWKKFNRQKAYNHLLVRTDVKFEAD